MAERRAKKAAEEAKETQANEQIRWKSAKVRHALAPIGDAADSRDFLRTSGNYGTS
jgi:hypothetical protein